MPNINEYININKQKPVEIVYELENKELMIPEERSQIINSFEERSNLINNKSKLSAAARNKIIKRHGSDYLSERTFNHDIALSQMYGPGFWDDFLKPVAKGALVVASFFPPTAPIAVPITIGVTTTGLIAKGIGHVSDNENWKKVGDDFIDIGSNAIDGQKVAGNSGITKKYWPDC